MNILSVKHLDTGYDKKQVLFDVSLEIPKNKITLLVGSNGSGKSTLLKAVYGIVKPWNNDAKIVFNNEDITGHKTSDMIKKGILYIPQKDGLFEDLSVKENIEISGMQTLEKDELKIGLNKVFEQIPGLKELLYRKCNKLSGGERKQVSFAMALINQPKLIMFDEPLAGVSPRNQGLIVSLIEGIKNSQVTLLIVEHRVKNIIGIADKIIGLKLGRIYKDKIISLNQINEVMI